MKRYVRQPDLIFTEMGDELVMMSIEQDAYFGLSGAGCKIWELIENPLSLGEIAQALTTEYEVDEETCRADAKAFLTQLEARKLVKAIEG